MGNKFFFVQEKNKSQICWGQEMDGKVAANFYLITCSVGRNKSNKLTVIVKR